MSTVAATVPHTTTPSASLPKAGAVAAVGGAVAALAVGVVGVALDVPMEVVPAGGGDLQEIPLGAFAVAAVVATALGTLLAAAVDRWTSRPSATFLAITIVATLLSFGPVAAQDATDATKVVLAVSHVAVAAVVIPVLALALRRREHPGPAR